MRIVAAATLTVGVVALVPSLATANGKITVCHYPPGNPDNPHTIEIAYAAWDAHQEKHDREGGHDTEGECPNPTTTAAATTTTVKADDTTTTAAATTTTVKADDTTTTAGPSGSTSTTVQDGSTSTEPSTPTSTPAATDGPTTTSQRSASSTSGTATSTEEVAETTSTVMATLPVTGPAPLAEKMLIIGIFGAIVGAIMLLVSRRKPEIS